MRRPAAFIDNHLLVCLAMAFITGIAVAPLAWPTPTAIRQLGLCLLTVLLFLAGLSICRRREAVFCLLLPFMAGVGFYSAQLHLQIPPHESHIFHRIETKTEGVLVGTLLTMPTFDGESSQLNIRAEYLRRMEDRELEAVTGTVLLRLPDKISEGFTPGDRLALRATLKRPDGARSPGVFDYAGYLAEKDIWITGFIRSAAHLHRLAEKPSWLRSLRYFPEKFRAQIGERIDAAVSGPTRGIYRAILIGDYSQVDDATLEAFKGSGTFHILSVSGLHMTVIGTFLYFTIYWLLSRSEWLLLRCPMRKVAAFLSLPILIFYSLLAGMNTPVLRAVIMSGLVIVALCTDRRKSPSTLLAFAALVILAVDPLQLFTASFQLSFAAVLAILFLYPALQKIILPDSSRPSQGIRARFGSWLVAGILVSVVATLATAPITLFFFNRFSTVGVVANLVVEPLVCLWSLPAGFVAILLQSVPELSNLCLALGSFGLEAALHVVRFFAALSGSTLWLPSPALWLLVLYLAALFAITFLTARKSSAVVKGLSVLLGLFMILICAPRLLSPRPPESLQVSVLDVGQGSSTLLQYPSGMNILVDGGGPAYGSSDSPSIGERAIAPFLWHKGIIKLHAIVITHPDADHYNGLDFIIDHFSPAVIWTRDTVGHDNAFKKLIELAAEEEIPVGVPAKGQLLGDGSGYLKCVENLATVGPFADSGKDRSGSNYGLVLKACDRGVCTLLPGDIGKTAEKFLIAEDDYDLKADFLLAPHHGSSTSNSSEFLTSVSPRVIVVSAGRAGGGHFPHKNLVEECERRRIPLLTTSRWGTLSIAARREACQIWGNDRPNNNPLRPFRPVLLHEEQIRGTPGEKSGTFLSGTE